MNIGPTCRRLRRERKLSLHDVSQRSNLAARTVWCIEHDTHDNRLSTLSMYAQGLGLSVGQLLCEAEAAGALSKLKVDERTAAGL